MMISTGLLAWSSQSQFSTLRRVSTKGVVWLATFFMEPLHPIISVEKRLIQSDLQHCIKVPKYSDATTRPSFQDLK